MTLRKALTLLESEKLIVKRHGSGSYVARKSNYRGGELDGFNYQMHIGGVTNYRNKVIEFTMLDAPLAIAQQLKIEPGEKVYYVRRIRMIDDVPILIENSYIPVAIFPWLSVRNLTISRKSAISPSWRATAAIPRFWPPGSKQSSYRFHKTACCYGCSRSAMPITIPLLIYPIFTRIPTNTMLNILRAAKYRGIRLTQATESRPASADDRRQLTILRRQTTTSRRR